LYADFEDRGAYESRRVVDRFTPAMLVEYCAALGLRPFDEDFYADECYRIVKVAKGWESPRPIRRSFHEEQYRRGFTDVKPDSII
ncbi:hypothetical protein, partial [Schaalia canis]|uniref:hypothetical protein n=1 Tax=Schaalia canis TaxID=100469 RepID=UPI00196AE695